MVHTHMKMDSCNVSSLDQFFMTELRTAGDYRDIQECIEMMSDNIRCEGKM
jgi:hypothetical protein